MDFSTKSALNNEYHEGDIDAPDLDEDRPDWSARSDFKNDPFTSFGPSRTRRIFGALAIFFFVALVGVGAAFAWRSYSGQQLTEMVTAQASAEVQQQLKPIVTDLAAMKRTIEQLTTNQDQLTRTQEQMAQTIAKLELEQQQLSQKLSSPPPLKSVPVPPSKPLQRPAQSSSKPVQILPPQSLQPSGH